MKNLEMLKNVLSPETYAKVEEETKDSTISLADTSKGDYVSSAKYTALETQLSETQKLLSSKSADYETLKSQAGDNTELKATIDKMKSDHENEINDIQSKHEAQLLANDTAVHIIQKYKPKDVSDVMRHVDMTKVSRNGESLIGIDEQVDAIKETKSYYFETDEGGNGSHQQGNAGGLPHGGNENDNAALRSAFGLNNKKE